MSIARPVAPVSAPPAWGPAARWLRAALVLGWLAFGVLVAVEGAHESSYGELQAAVAAGDVDAVTVDGDGLEPGGTGFATVRVTWRDGLLADTTQVLVARPLGEARDAGAREVTAVLDTGVAEDLRALDPGIEVRQESRSTSVGEEPAGWYLDGWLVWPALILSVGTFFSVVASPPPWRATRWAWFWLVANPVGLAAYLLLAGPLPGLGRRLAAPQRLTGGWAFLLAVGLGSLLGW